MNYSERMLCPEALDKTKTLAAGAGGHQHAAQEASRHPQGSLAYLEQASANIPAPMKQTWRKGPAH